jgi:hypothetical protein
VKFHQNITLSQTEPYTILKHAWGWMFVPIIGVDTFEVFMKSLMHFPLQKPDHIASQRRNNWGGLKLLVMNSKETVHSW